MNSRTLPVQKDAYVRLLCTREGCVCNEREGKKMLEPQPEANPDLAKLRYGALCLSTS